MSNVDRAISGSGTNAGNSPAARASARTSRSRSVRGTTAPTPNSSHNAFKAGTYSEESILGTARRWCAAYCAGASGFGSAAITVACWANADTMSYRFPTPVSRTAIARGCPSASLSLVDAFAAEHHPNGPGQDPQIERQRPVLDVPQVELDPLGPRQRRAAVDLRPPGDPRLDGEPATLALGVLLDLDRERRARADDRHLAADHVPQVRKLVERVAAQEVAEARDPRVALGDGEAGAREFGAVDHRPQLVDREQPSVETHPRLRIDRVAARLEPDRNRERTRRPAPSEQRPRRR